jgi:uncharacterized protein YhjY with autotransporter beta-barrel domain
MTGMTMISLCVPASAAPSWSGGSGTPLSLTFDQPLNFTIKNATTATAPFFVIQGIPLLNSPTTGTLNYSINGGSPIFVDYLSSGFSGGDITANDSYFYSTSGLQVLQNGDTITLNPGTLTTTSNFAGTAPTETVFGNFLFDNFGETISDIVSSVPIPSGPPPEELSAVETGLPMANVLGQMLISGNQTATSDVNNHIFGLMAGDGEEAASSSLSASLDDGVVIGQGDGPEDPIAHKVLRSRQWEVYTTVNYGYLDLNALGGQAGVNVESWAPGIGIERHLSRGLAVGFAVSFLQSWQDYSGGLGSLDLEGPALSTYLTFVRKNYWSSLLYSFGSYELDSTRNPGLGFPQAYGSTHSYTNSVQYNTGWNFRFQNNTLLTGPFAGIDYLHGTVDAYSETGGGAAALRYAEQSYESLVTRVGWSASKKIKTDFASITPQVRLSYERQNLENNGTSVALLNAPFTAAGGNQSPGQDYLAAGAGVNFAFNDQLSVLLSYQGQFFRSDMSAHLGALRLSYKF